MFVGTVGLAGGAGMAGSTGVASLCFFDCLVFGVGLFDFFKRGVGLVVFFCWCVLLFADGFGVGMYLDGFDCLFGLFFR